MNRTISKVIMILLLISLFVPICIHYINMSYPFAFSETISYDDIFFETDSCEYNIYGIGSYDIYADRLIENELYEKPDEPPYSNTKNYYEKRGVEMYPEFLIEQRNDILKKCSFQKVDFIKSFALSFMFGYMNNITTIKINKGYMDANKKDPRFSELILQDLLIEGNGIVNAGVYNLFGKTYLMADYALFSEKNIEGYDYKDDTVIKKCIFEVLPSEKAEQLVEIKYSSQASMRDSYKARPISIWYIIIFLFIFLAYLKWKNKYKKDCSTANKK